MRYSLPFVLLSLAVSAREERACYKTSTGAFFTNHEFHDFRSYPDGLASVPPLPDRLPKDPIPQSSDYSTNPNIGQLQEGWLKTDEWNKSWAIQDWGKLPTSDFPVRMQNSLSNVYLISNDTATNSSSKLVLRTHRFDGFQSAAEVESLTKNLFYASIRIRARVYGAEGAVAGLFIFQNNRNESDIEVLTRDPKTRIRYTNQPVLDDEGNEIPGASTEVDLQSNASPIVKSVRWDEWHTHRIDWVKGKSSWFVDGVHLLDTKYSVPTVPSYFVMNMWSDGGEWSGNMTNGQTAYLEIEFIEMVYNTSGRNPTKSKRAGTSIKCRDLYSVDDVSVVGTPEPAGQTGSAATVAAARAAKVALIQFAFATIAVFGLFCGF